jgi:hypothetical protein
VASDIPSWAGAISAEALAELLGFQGERAWLDYKTQCDLTSARGVVELAKDAGAMMITGGYVVVGADSHGQPTGDVEHLDLFDEATLRAKIAKYLPKPIEVRSAAHHYRGQSFAVVYFAPHPDGFCIFETDGTYQDTGGKTHTVFRRGEVFARHGTSSERWQQSDVGAIKQHLQAGADRLRDDAADALQLLHGLPRHLGGSGLWLAIAVIPEYQQSDAPLRTTEQAEKFLQELQFANAPIETLGSPSGTFRQPGGLVMTDQTGGGSGPHWWRLALYDAGSAVGAHVLSHEVAADPISDDKKWYGLPPGITEKPTVPARRDEVEIRLLLLLDLLTAHASAVQAGGQVLIMATLVALTREPHARIALLNEMVDESGKRSGWRLAGYRANRPLEEVAMQPVTYRGRLADMRDPATRIRAANRLAAELLSLFAIDRPSMLTADGTLDPDGAGIDRAQMVYQHARHLGLPVGPVSPIERQQQLEEAIRAAQAEYRRR